MRKWIIALAILMVVPALGAAATIYVANPTPEQLVEGHTVFTVITARAANTTNETRYAAAVAVLVQERNDSRAFSRFPGVLWFNDQYLVDPSADTTCTGTAHNGNSAVGQPDDYCTDYRYPCSGAVIAVNSGNADPRLAALPAYTDSYLVTDPNDHSWNVDHYGTGTGSVWAVPILNNDLNANTPDDGTTNCAPYKDADCGGPAIAPVVPRNQPDRPFNDSGAAEGRLTNTCLLSNVASPGDNGFEFPTVGGNALKYNAVLFFFMSDLTAAGVKDHNDGSVDRTNDVSGCQPDTPWPCPAADDNREGNSHAYNAGNPYPLATYDGKFNHGGSAACPDGLPHMSPDGTYANYRCHETSNVDLYYGAYPPPTTRNYAFKDVEGSTAPYYCEDSIAAAGPCNQQDLEPIV